MAYRSLNLPDRQLRPQPKRLLISATPLFSLTQPCPLSDVRPREPIHHSPHIPMPMMPHPQVGHSDGSFTFLSSTCSEGEAAEDTNTTVASTLETPGSYGRGHHYTSPSHVCVQYEDHGHTHHHLTNEQRATDSRCSGAGGMAHCVGYTHTDGLPSCLKDSSVQMEILQMRETLRSFHLLKDRQK